MAGFGVFRNTANHEHGYSIVDPSQQAQAAAELATHKFTSPATGETQKSRAAWTNLN
jgi:hypothetical protein